MCVRVQCCLIRMNLLPQDASEDENLVSLENTFGVWFSILAQVRVHGGDHSEIMEGSNLNECALVIIR